MVKNMYKERAKTTINPFFSTIVWLLGTYMFTIIWGIVQILFEFDFALGKHIICFLTTVFYAWFLISRLLTEYEFVVSDGKLVINKVLSKRSNQIKLIALPNIKNVCKSRQKCKEAGVKKIKSFTRPAQKGEAVYVIYKDGDDLSAVKLKPKKELMKILRKKQS